MTIRELIAELKRQPNQDATVYLRDGCHSPQVASCVAPVKGYRRGAVVDPDGVIILEPVDW